MAQAAPRQEHRLEEGSLHIACQVDNGSDIIIVNDAGAIWDPAGAQHLRDGTEKRTGDNDNTRTGVVSAC